MKIIIPEDPNRIIGSRDHNIHVANGIDAHKSTGIVPSSLLHKIDPNIIDKFQERYHYIQNILCNTIGEPYYSNSGFILYKGDCTKYLELLGKSILKAELIITSPPYNIGKEYEEVMSIDEYISWCSRWMDQLFKINSDNGAFWLNVGFIEVEGKGLCVPIPYLIWNKSQFYFIQEIVWAYGAGVSTKSRLCPRNEKWLFYVKNPKFYTFNLDDIRDPNVKYPNQKKNGKYRCNPLGKNPSDVWEFPKVTTGKDRSSKERTSHPAQFPLGVIERVIRASSNCIDLVLDPFAGSCSTGIAAIGLNRVFVGFEIREDYCRESIERFENFISRRNSYQKQITLF